MKLKCHAVVLHLGALPHLPGHMGKLSCTILSMLRKSAGKLLVKLDKTDPTVKLYSTADLTNVASGAVSACREVVYLERCNVAGIIRNSPKQIRPHVNCGITRNQYPVRLHCFSRV